MPNASLGNPPRWLVIVALVAIQILFGVGYVVSKIVVEAFTPLVWASLRIIISTGLMFAAVKILRRPHPKADRHFFLPLVGFALLGIIINQASFLVGLRYTTSTNSAILNTLIPVFTLLIVTVRGQEPATFLRIVGFLLSFTGVLVLRKVENLSLSDQTFIGDLLTVLNCFSYGLFLSYGKKFLEKYDRIWTTVWLFAYGSVGLTLIAIPDYMNFQMPVMTPLLFGCVVFAVVGTTLLTYFLNNWTLAYTKSSNVALFIYIQPVVASGIAYFFKGEVITLRTVLSCGLIFIGVVTVLMSKERVQKKAVAI